MPTFPFPTEILPAMLVRLKFACALAALCAIGLHLQTARHAWSQLPVTQQRAVYPPVAQVGATTKVEVLGQAPLEEIDRLIFSHPGISANVLPGDSDPITGATSTQYGKFTLSVASDLPPGFYEVNSVGRHGVSYPRVFWVTKLPVVSIAQPGSEKEPAPALALSSIVTDRYTAARSHRYSLSLSSGQKVRVVALDAKLDSRALSQMRITNPAGRPVAFARSVGTSGAIAQFSADVTGAFMIELHDSVFRGGDEFFFALFAEPMEAASENAATANVDSTSGAWTSRDQLLPLLKPTAGQLSVASQLSGLNVERWLTSELAFTVAQPGQATKVAPPCLVSGLFTTDTTGEAIEFDAKKGDTYWIEVASKSLGESTDAYLSISRVTTAEGASKLTRITDQDDAPPIGTVPFRIVRSDPSIKFDVPEDGTYRVSVRDQFATSKASAGKRFLVAIRKPEPSMTLVAAWSYPTNNQAQAKPIGNNLLKGGSVVMRVIVSRNDGLTGPVELSVEGLPAGVTVEPIVIPADKEEGNLVFTCNDQAAAATAPLKIVGRVSKPGDKTGNKTGDASTAVQAQAISAALTWEPIPSWNALISRLSEQALLSVNEKDSMPVTFQVGNGEPLVMARGGKLPVPITVTRRNGTADKAVLKAQGLPAKTTLADVTIEGTAKEAKPELTVAADAPVGEAVVWFQAETKVKFRNNPQAYERAEATKAELEKLLADPARAADKDKITAALKAATDKLAPLKDQTAEKDVAVFLPTNAFRIKVIEGPITADGDWKLELKRGAESDQALKIKRLLGFEAAVDVKLVSDSNTAGIEMTAPAIAEKTDECKCHFKVAADAAVGTRSAACKLSYKFNGQDLSMTLPLSIVVVE